MTLRFDDRRRPVGLDWATLSARCEQDPSVWANASRVNPKRPTTRLPDETEMLIVRLHLDGMAAVDIAKQADVSAVTVSAVLDRHEIRENRGRGTRQRTPDHIAREVIRLYVDEGLAGAEIGERTGVRHATVYKILRRNGVPVRSQGTRSRVAA